MIDELEIDFPEIDNIQENELIKKIDNEWYLNDFHGLDWDHPEFCLEANEVDQNDGNEYVYFDSDDIRICFLEHGDRSSFCVTKKNGQCPNTKESSKKEFEVFMKSLKIPSFLIEN